MVLYIKARFSHIQVYNIDINIQYNLLLQRDQLIGLDAQWITARQQAQKEALDTK